MNPELPDFYPVGVRETRTSLSTSHKELIHSPRLKWSSFFWDTLISTLTLSCLPSNRRNPEGKSRISKQLVNVRNGGKLRASRTLHQKIRMNCLLLYNVLHKVLNEVHFDKRLLSRSRTTRVSDTVRQEWRRHGSDTSRPSSCGPTVIRWVPTDLLVCSVIYGLLSSESLSFVH